MFAPVARRLAVTNAIVIAIVVAIVGALGFSAVRYRLDQQARDALAQRALAAGVGWAPELASGELKPIAIPPPATPSPSKDREDSPADDLIESGDTVLLAYDRTGALVANPRGLAVANLPLASSVTEALAGKTTSQRIAPAKGEHFDLYTAPLRDNGAIVGVIQAIQGSGEHDRAVQLLWLAILGSAGLGMLLAAPAGLYLARRAMRPISHAFEQQRAFVADAAHELRTPLAVLRANAELIERLPGISRQELVAEIGGMVGEIDEMNRLVNDLLDLARADAGRLVVDIAPVARRSRRWRRWPKRQDWRLPAARRSRSSPRSIANGFSSSCEGWSTTRSATRLRAAASTSSSSGEAAPRSSKCATRASASGQRINRTSSAAFTGPTMHAPDRREGPAWACRSPMQSSPPIADASRLRARRARARRSAFNCRSPDARLREARQSWQAR